ncbi:hypothetical protein PBI_GAIA_40 [Mycobacterium phage Gaia]|uniref:Uncharacterized protein n=1 Tax=Mycobacterium phage Gaia TaxID=1486472 RepID=A0A068F8N0_9CAUD|nr:hypothetical protein VC46_gp040 [Mycobacterium phage Gaia]AID58860.1 hypothetical protein PBI_GAIA_40 [Mycobacterium phage Gaia]AYQ99982.1 hypothetical protein PBI_NEBKISS_41 [Mycobacterium phage Nebkiss]
MTYEQGELFLELMHRDLRDEYGDTLSETLIDRIAETIWMTVLKVTT